ADLLRVFAENQRGAGQHLGGTGFDLSLDEIEEVVAGVTQARVPPCRIKETAGSGLWIQRAELSTTDRVGPGVSRNSKTIFNVVFNFCIWVSHPPKRLFRGWKSGSPGTQQLAAVVDDEVIAVAERDTVIDLLVVVEGHIQVLEGE
ncbi:MAG: hypothetical protein ACK55I_04215, partial [bacterium]